MKSHFFLIPLMFLILTSGCLEKECETPTDCATKTCFTSECRDNSCLYSPISNCCGNDLCEPEETYSNCVADCPNCDDSDKCTKDSYDYHRQGCVNTPILDVVCCGNDLCEPGETYLNCARDCANCNDDNECTKDSYDYHRQGCLNEPMVPCCGNGLCEEGTETYANCPVDCPDCDDNYPLTTDSFNYTTQQCKNSLHLKLAEGFKYTYVTAHCSQCQKRDSFIYVTKETPEYWEGISVVRMDDSKKAYLMRWRIKKSDLSMAITMPLTEDKLSGDVDYISDIKEIERLGECGDSILPLYIPVLRELMGLNIEELVTTHKTTINVDSQHTAVFSTSDPAPYSGYPAYTINIDLYQNEELTGTGHIIMSAVEPYLVIDIGIAEGPLISFKRADQEDFSLDDYSGYSISEWTPPQNIPEEPKPREERV